MKKVHPNALHFPRNDGVNIIPDRPPSEEEEAVLTVWKKSLLFNCNGFTVFDCKGDLMFRVDNYMEGNKGSILLMDANGKPLLTIRRKKMSLGLSENWLVYEGEETRVNPRFTVKKSVNMLNSKCLAYVTDENSKVVVYEIEGSYSRRCCAVLDEKKRLAAEIRPKDGGGGVALGTDVFRLMVKTDHMRMDVAMGVVILLDQIFK